jgi:hypothetical protein
MYTYSNSWGCSVLLRLYGWCWGSLWGLWSFSEVLVRIRIGQSRVACHLGIQGQYHLIGAYNIRPTGGMGHVQRVMKGKRLSLIERPRVGSAPLCKRTMSGLVHQQRTKTTRLRAVLKPQVEQSYCDPEKESQHRGMEASGRTVLCSPQKHILLPMGIYLPAVGTLTINTSVNSKNRHTPSSPTT